MRAEGVLLVAAGVVVAVVLLLVVVVVGAVVCVCGWGDGGMAGRFRWCSGIGGSSVGWARGMDDRQADMHEAAPRLLRVSRRARTITGATEPKMLQRKGMPGQRRLQGTRTPSNSEQTAQAKGKGTAG